MTSAVPSRPGRGQPTAGQANPDTWLDAARRLLNGQPKAPAAWSRACAWLIRLALEAELITFWAQACPTVNQCRSHRAQFLLLPQYLDPAVGRRAYQVWAVLSRAGHHHSYELGLTASELHRLLEEATATIAALRERQTE